MNADNAIKFKEVRDANGTLLQSYVESLLEKARLAGYISCLIFHREDIKDTHVVANITNLPELLRELAKLFEGQSNADEVMPGEEQLELPFDEVDPILVK